MTAYTHQTAYNHLTDDELFNEARVVVDFCSVNRTAAERADLCERSYEILRELQQRNYAILRELQQRNWGNGFDER